jgi:hypothetical protein
MLIFIVECFCSIFVTLLTIPNLKMVNEGPSSARASDVHGIPVNGTPVTELMIENFEFLIHVNLMHQLFAPFS